MPYSLPSAYLLTNENKFMRPTLANSFFVFDDSNSFRPIKGQTSKHKLAMQSVNLFSFSKVPSKEDFDKIPALDIAEELTYLDFHIFRSIKTQ